MKYLPALCRTALFVLLASVSARANTVTIAWDPNSEPDLAGYVVLYGTTSGQYVSTIDVGTLTTWTLSSGEAGRTYYFTVQAYNALGQRSARAAEILATVPPPASTPPSVPPFGVMDTPVNGITGVTGSLAVTGWALDDSGVVGVGIYRDPVAGEGAGAPIFIGDAAFVEGARPDVAVYFPGHPGNGRAGWGYLLLTNMLPNRGTGTYRLHAIATDGEGAQALLGSRTINVANNGATRPFGAIDSPTQGGTVFGSIFHNFGWVLSPGARRADPTGGGTVTVLIDGVPVGSPSGWTSRSDLAALFPADEYAGIGTAAGVFTFDTTQLADGLHTIAWSVADNQVPPNTDGIGSRFFRVANGTAQTAAVARSSAAAAARRPELGEEIASMLRDPRTLLARRGFNLDTPLRRVKPLSDGRVTRVTIEGEELDRFELRPEGPMWTAGYMRYGDALSPLPIGSRLDPATGTFTWQPGVGFVGTYDFVFVRSSAGLATTADDVRIVLHPKGSGRVGPQVVIDTPSSPGAFGATDDILVAGWALDLDAAEGTGVSTLHVWAYPRAACDGAACDPIFLGVTTMGGRRPDVAAVFGDQFRDAGYGLYVRGLAPGDYQLAVFAWSTVVGGWVPARTVPVTVR